jgi:hypothetical protein
MRARCADDGDDGGDYSAVWHDVRRDVHGGAALRRGEALLKPEWKIRRLPPNTMPAQQATGETQPTEPYSILFEAPNSAGVQPTFAVPMRVPMWQEQGAMRRCKIDIGAILRLFRDENRSASLRPQALAAIFRPKDF